MQFGEFFDCFDCFRSTFFETGTIDSFVHVWRDVSTDKRDVDYGLCNHD